MTQRDLGDAIEVIRDKLFWAALHSMPKNTMKSHYFTIDKEFVYEPFSADFGPLNLSCVCRYCRILDSMLKDPALQDKRIIHFCSHDPKKRANAAFLICAYQVVVMRKPAEVAFEPFCGIYPPFLPFRDAISGPCTFQCTITDCLLGLQKSIDLRWFDWTQFDVESYDFFEKVDNGDMSWIVPNKFLAFAGPCPTSTDADGFPAFTPEDYVPIFRDAGISLVVRLNKKQYDRRRFIDHGIKHVDLYFLDGSCPPPEIVAKFLHIIENEPGAVAIHCKAGLGRTGTLIGLFCMKHFNFPARAFIGWARICRPGSILGPQQQFLCDMQAEMWQAGQSFRGPGRQIDDKELSAQMQRLNVRGDTRERAAHEMIEDVGQGERLCGARRQGGMFGGGDAGGGGGNGSGRDFLRGGPRDPRDPHDQRDPRDVRDRDPREAPPQVEAPRQRQGMIRRGLRGMFSL